MAIRYWLGVVHRSQALRYVEFGVAQMNHGSRAAVAALREADGLAYYSPREYYPDGPSLQAFTAVGRVRDGQVFQAQDSPARTGAPWRRRVDYLGGLVEAPIRPLLGLLDFTRDRPNWGAALRGGLLEITRRDFELILGEMQPPPPDDPLSRFATRLPG